MNKTLRTPEENLKRSNSSYRFKVTITLYDKLVLKDQKKQTKKKNTFSPWAKGEITLQFEIVGNENINTANLNFRGCNQISKQGNS